VLPEGEGDAGTLVTTTEENGIDSAGLAAYGVAGLVAGIIAGKAANVGMLAALVVAGKKFAVVIGVGVVALLSRAKSLFRRKTQTS
jgi:uncharacterized membrane-anchored protein